MTDWVPSGALKRSRAGLSDQTAAARATRTFPHCRRVSGNLRFYFLLAKHRRPFVMCSFSTDISTKIMVAIGILLNNYPHDTTTYPRECLVIKGNKLLFRQP